MSNTNRTNIHEFFLKLVRLGIGTSKDAKIPKNIDWLQLKALSDAQGLSAVVLDGIDRCHTDTTESTDYLPVQMKLEWIGEVLNGEQTYKLHQEVATDMANLFHQNGIRTYVLKGRIVAECYPKPEHRVSSDMDCLLLPAKGVFNAWQLGNDLVKAKGHDVGEGFYKNSSFHLPGLMVENHQFLTPFRGNERLEKLERFFQEQFKEFNGLSTSTSSVSVQNVENSRIDGTWLYRPPEMVSALFLIEHAYSHFLHEGLTWRMVLDWVLFSKKHQKQINWTDFETYIDEFGFRKFYDSFSRLGQYLIGEIQDSSFTIQNQKMLEDVWAPLDLHESLQGVKAKFQLAGNYWRARWKYKYFTDMTWVRALTEWVTGAVFDRHPKLD